MGMIEHQKIQHSKPGNKSFRPTRKYWWIWGDTGTRRIVWGAYNSRDEAYRIAISKLNVGNFECVELPTRDEAAASRMLRARLLNESTPETIDSAFARFKHTGKLDGMNE